MDGDSYYEIVGTYRGNAEVIDTADTEEAANYLVGEYQLAYGNEWSVSWRHASEG